MQGKGMIAFSYSRGSYNSLNILLFSTEKHIPLQACSTKNWFNNQKKSWYYTSSNGCSLHCNNFTNYSHTTRLSFSNDGQLSKFHQISRFLEMIKANDKGTISTRNIGFEERNSPRKEIFQHTLSFLWGEDKRINNMWQMLVMLPNTQLEAAQTQPRRMKFVSSSWVGSNTTPLGSFPNSVPPALQMQSHHSLTRVKSDLYSKITQSGCDLGCSAIDQVRPQRNQFW